MQIFRDAFEFILTIGPYGCLLLVLPLVLFEIPRYTLLYFISNLTNRKARPRLETLPPYSVIIAGHNEAHTIKNVVLCLREQSHPPDEILVVSDGSTDETRSILSELYDKKLISYAQHLDLRSGKAASLNLILSYAKNDIVAQVDCDCSFDRHAMRQALAPFADERVGVVSGNVLPRNDDKNLLTAMQMIEYLIAISLGRQASDLMDQVAIASGAFSVFRRSALDDISGYDFGSGEDLDITLKLRQRGWQVRFEPGAICYTNVPEKLPHLISQRMRWERDAIAIRYRKYNDVIDPFDRRFDPRESVHQIEFILFNILSAAVAPIYIAFVALWFGEGAWIVFMASYLFLLLHDLVVFLIATYQNNRYDALWLIPLLPVYSLFNILFMRNLRIFAYFDEWFRESAMETDFIPAKVRNYHRGTR